MIRNQATLDLIARRLPPRDWNGVQDLLRRCGVREYVWRWAGPDIAAVWAGWVEAPELALFLVGAGFGVDEVARPAVTLASSSPTLASRVVDELRWRTPVAVHNAYAVLCRYVPREAVCDMLRVQFPLIEVARRLTS